MTGEDKDGEFLQKGELKDSATAQPLAPVFLHFISKIQGKLSHCIRSVMPLREGVLPGIAETGRKRVRIGKKAILLPSDICQFL